MQLNDLRLISRSSSVEIRNLPFKEQENSQDLLTMLSGIGQAIQLNIQSTDLRDIYRLPGKPNTTRPVIAEFSTVSMRNEFLSTVRRYNKERALSEKLNTTSIGISGERKAVYVDEHIAPTLKKLFYQTRLVAKTNNFTCWHTNGKIFVRKEKDAKPMQIKTENCLDFLGNPNGKQ